MKNWIILAIVLSSAALASPSKLNCSFYSIGAVPFCDVSVGFSTEGKPDAYATITSFGRSHRETVAVASPVSGERLHFVLSKESPENLIDLIVTETAGSAPGTLHSELINPRMPDGFRIINGNCDLE